MPTSTTNHFDNLIRGFALISILCAGSCAVGRDGVPDTLEDGAANHPITVEPSYRELKMQFSGGPSGVSAEDAAKFDAFLADYRAHGNGSISIAVPAGAPSHAAITFFAERAAATGISRDKILVSTHDVMGGDLRVDVSYITYTAKTDTCGDWSENLAFTLDNGTPKNFGCSVQQNIAAMVADPRDLIGPRRFDPADANRAGVIITNYEQGKITQAEKHTADSGVEQSAPGSDVGKN